MVIIELKPEIDGLKFTGIWEDSSKHLIDGEFVYYDSEYYILHNNPKMQGSVPKDMKGYLYGWCISHGTFKYLTNIKIKNKIVEIW